MASSLSQADVNRLLAESSPSVRAEVAEKLAREIDSTALTEAELQLAHDVVRVMARDVETTVRQALSHSLRRAVRLPHDVAIRLAQDVEAVALPVLTDSPVLTDADLVEIVRGGSAEKHTAIAERAAVSETVSDALISHADEQAVAALMGNAGAEIGEASLDKAIGRFQHSDRVKSSMVRRPRLPVTIAERLMVMVSDRLQEWLMGHHDLPAALVGDVMLQSRERATLSLSYGSNTHALERLLKQMHRHGRLTPLLVLRAICIGDMAFFQAAMAVLAGIPVLNARILIEDAGSKGFASLYQKAGMPLRLMTAFKVAVEVVSGTEFDGGERDLERYRSRVIARILTQFEDLPPDDLDYLLDKLSDVLSPAV